MISLEETIHSNNHTKGTLKRNFTLIELVVVIIIIATLVSIAVPQYHRVMERGRQAEGLHILSQIHASQLRYHYDHNYSWPVRLTDLDIEIPPLKYFNVPVLYNDGSATIGRNSVSAGLWSYTIRVDINGTFSYSTGEGPSLP